MKWQILGKLEIFNRILLHCRWPNTRNILAIGVRLNAISLICHINSHLILLYVLLVTLALFFYFFFSIFSRAYLLLLLLFCFYIFWAGLKNNLYASCCFIFFIIFLFLPTFLSLFQKQVWVLWSYLFQFFVSLGHFFVVHFLNFIILLFWLLIGNFGLIHKFFLSQWKRRSSEIFSLGHYNP